MSIKLRRSRRFGKMERGKWKMENGKWKMENGEWKMESGKWKVESCMCRAKSLLLYSRTCHFYMFVILSEAKDPFHNVAYLSGFFAEPVPSGAQDDKNTFFAMRSLLMSAES